MKKETKEISAGDNQVRSFLSKNIVKLVLAAVVLIIIIAMVFVDNQPARLVIKNNSGQKLEYAKVTYVDSEGPIGKMYTFENMENKTTSYNDLEKISLNGVGANLEIRFKFEDSKEMLVDAGIFNQDYNGKLSISFNKSNDDIIKLKVKASSVLAKSNNIDCNESYDVHYKDGYVAD